MRASERLDLGFEDLFENIAGQGGYVLVRDLSLNGYPVGGLTDRRTSIWMGNAQAMIRTRDYHTTDSPRLIASRIASQRRHYLAIAFHETFHHLSKNGFGDSDEDLGRAAFHITEDRQLLPGPGNHDPLRWSSYIDNQLAKKCMPDMVRAGPPPY